MQFRTILCFIIVLISAVSAALFESVDEGYGRQQANYPKRASLSNMMRIGKRNLPLQDAAHQDYYYPCESCNLGSINRLG